MSIRAAGNHSQLISFDEQEENLIDRMKVSYLDLAVTDILQDLSRATLAKTERGLENLLHLDLDLTIYPQRKVQGPVQKPVQEPVPNSIDLGDIEVPFHSSYSYSASGSGSAQSVARTRRSASGSVQGSLSSEEGSESGFVKKSHAVERALVGRCKKYVSDTESLTALKSRTQMSQSHAGPAPRLPKL